MSETAQVLMFGGALFALCCLIGLGSLALQFRREASKNWDLYYELHQFKTAFLTQEMVGDRLRHLAQVFESASAHQAQALSGHADSATVERAIRATEEAKQAFWAAHNAAQRWGYKVHGSFKAYLPGRFAAAN